jgi:hypothetical protein
MRFLPNSLSATSRPLRSRGLLKATTTRPSCLLDGEEGVLGIPPQRAFGQQGFVELGKLRLDVWHAELICQHLGEFTSVDEAVFDENLAKFFPDLGLLLEIERCLQLSLLDIPQLHQEIPKAQRRLVGGERLPQLLLGDVLQFLQDLQEYFGGSQLGLYTLGIGELLRREMPGFDE